MSVGSILVTCGSNVISAGTQHYKHGILRSVGRYWEVDTRMEDPYAEILSRN